MESPYLSTFSYRRIWQIAFPILISTLIEQMIGMTDTAFLGRVSEVALGASALAGVYYLVLFMLGLGFSMGVQIVIGRRNGEGRLEETGHVFWHGLYFLVVLGLFVTLLSEILSPYILRAMVQSPDVLAAASGYVRWRVAALSVGFATAMLRAFFIGTMQTRALMVNSLVMLLSNFLLNWMLVFGHFGLPALGIEGAAIGSALAEVISLVAFVLYTRRHCDVRRYGLQRLPRWQWRVMRPIWGVAAWKMVQSFLSIGTWFTFFLYIEHTGERALAVSNVVRNISGLVWMMLVAFASTGSTMVSNAIGSGHSELVGPLVGRVLRFSYLVILPLLLVISVFPETFIRIYTDIPDLIGASVPSLLVLCASYLLSIPAFVLFDAVSGTGNTKSAFALEMLALVIYVAYCAVVIEWLRCDVAVCWIAEAVYAAVMFLCSALYLRSGRWRGMEV